MKKRIFLIGLVAIALISTALVLTRGESVIKSVYAEGPWICMDKIENGDEMEWKRWCGSCTYVDGYFKNGIDCYPNP